MLHGVDIFFLCACRTLHWDSIKCFYLNIFFLDFLEHDSAQYHVRFFWDFLQDTQKIFG